VCLNAGAALYAADVVPSIMAGIELARVTIASGAAHAKMQAFVAATQQLARA
jgi:anthranilate phosphoribosyltransferase